MISWSLLVFKFTINCMLETEIQARTNIFFFCLSSLTYYGLLCV